MTFKRELVIDTSRQEQDRREKLRRECGLRNSRELHNVVLSLLNWTIAQMRLPDFDIAAMHPESFKIEVILTLDDLKKSADKSQPATTTRPIVERIQMPVPLVGQVTADMGACRVSTFSQLLDMGYALLNWAIDVRVAHLKVSVINADRKHIIFLEMDAIETAAKVRRAANTIPFAANDTDDSAQALRPANDVPDYSGLLGRRPQ
jgi:hypothetical protein